jgi:tetratricopeptide (TPR) repeat protein
MTASADGLHAGVAEHGKVCALRGEHVAALVHYRQAMSMAIGRQAPEVVVRHYLECALESLEHMGAYDEVLAYCDRAIEHYRLHPPESALARVDLASIYQRRGVALLKRGDLDEAARSLEVASATARTAPAALPLSDTLLRWLTAKLTISAERIAGEQARHRYFSVRPENVRPSRAVPLPGALKGPSSVVAIVGDSHAR